MPLRINQLEKEGGSVNQDEMPTTTVQKDGFAISRSQCLPGMASGTASRSLFSS